ncbi:MAG: exodeoxyribonuclease VII small subunit, partial [Pseudomonadota bacterium]
MARAKSVQDKRPSRTQNAGTPGASDASGVAASGSESADPALPESFEAALDRLEAVVDALEGG